MSTLVCGRCGNRTAPNSSYCPHDRWTLWIDPPQGDPRIAAAIASLEVPRGLGGLLERMRLEKQRTGHERELESTLDKRIEELEERLEAEPADFEAHRRLGILTLLRHHYERAHAHLKRAHELNPHDFETHINYAIVLAQRGQLQPSLETLQAAHKQWPGTPLVLFNLALIALQARRANLVLEAVAALEALWQKNPAIAAEYREDGLSARGLALLLLNRNDEAYVALHAAAGGTAANGFAANGNAAPASTRDGALNDGLIGEHDGDAAQDEDGFYAVTAAERRQLIHAVETFGDEHPSQTASAVAPVSSAQAAAAQATAAQAAAAQTAAERRLGDRRVAPPDVPWPHDERRSRVRREAQPAAVAPAAPPPTPLPSATDAGRLDGVEANADRLNNLAIAEAAAGHYDRAVARLGTAMRLEPGNTRIHNNLGVLAYQQGSLPLAFKHLNLARQIEEYAEQHEPETHNHLGVVLSAMGKLDESWEEFQHAGSHERAEFEVWYNLGRAFIEAGKADKGVSYLKRAYQANPQQPDVHVLLGAAYLLRGSASMLPEALKYLKRSLQLAPRHQVAFCNLVMTLCEMENQEGARLVVNQAMKAYPRSPELIFLRALITLHEEEENSVARAGALFSGAQSIRPDLLVSFYNMALCQFVLGMRDAAAQQLEAVTQLDPSFAPAYYLMGVGHALANRFDEALAAWQKAAQYEPGNPDLQANMGFVYFQRGDWDNAIACYMRAHRAAPHDADILSCLGLSFGRAARKLSDAWEAIALKKSTTPKPGSPQEERTYNELLNRSITAFEQSLTLKPHSPITHSNLGLVFYFRKQVENAVDQWRIVSQLDARYASRREEEQYRNFDESQIAMRPLNWRARVIGIAPILPRPHTRLLPGHNARAFRPALTDPALQKVYELRRELENTVRMLGWLHAHK